MAEQHVEPCRVCGTAEHLRPKWDSQTRQRWVHCDGCGRIGTPSVDEHPLEVWNREQRKEHPHG